MFSVGLVIVSSQTFAQYRLCDDAYCFTIPEQNKDSLVSLHSARSTCRDLQTMLLEIKSFETQTHVDEFVTKALFSNKLSLNPVLLNAERNDADSYSWVNGLVVGTSSLLPTK